jgi:protein-tyrosine kinase
MGLMLDALKQIEDKTPSAPMILPLNRDMECNAEFRMINNECLGSVKNASTGESIPHSAFNMQHSSIQRFAFPAVPEPLECLPIPEPPKAIWPDSIDTETAQACAKTADHILDQLSLKHPMVLAFTSPFDGDGKTSLLVGLAPQLAKRIPGNVLVVDANTDKPDLTRQLTVSVAKTIDSSDLIYPTNLERLNVLPFQTAVPKTRQFDRDWIEDLHEGWPLALLDMPSLMHPEVARLARYCDGVYLVVRLGHTTRRAVSESARLIRHSGGKLLGCVVVE